MQKQTLVATLVAAVLALSLGIASSEQRPADRYTMPIQRPILCRLQYSSDVVWDEFDLIYRRGDGNVSNGGWSTDFPASDMNMGVRLSELTKVRIDSGSKGFPTILALLPDDPKIFECPLLLASDVGAMELRPQDISPLRAYLQKCGFLWVDDFWGTPAWDHWVKIISQVLPPWEYRIEDLPLSHPLFRTFFLVSEVPQVVDLDTMKKDLTQEVEGPDGAEVHVRAIFDRKGRMLVLMTHNTDIQNGWEREWSPDYQHFAWSGYLLGINAVLYALTH